MSKENRVPEDDVLELSESGKQTRINQILEKREVAAQALDMDDVPNNQVYQVVRSYVREFEGIATEGGLQAFLKDRPMGEITLDAVRKSLSSSREDYEIVDKDKYPIKLRGAEEFITLNEVVVKIRVSSNELNSSKETIRAAIDVPWTTSHTAYRSTELFRARIGLELKNKSLPSDDI